MKATIIAVGSELLGYTRVETNSLEIAHKLENHGVRIARKTVVPDEVAAIGSTLRHDLGEVDLVVVTGGIGPTEDDVTKEAVARELGLALDEDELVLEAIRRSFENRQIEMPEVNRRQARVFRGHRTVLNHHGTAPGFHLDLAFEGSSRHIWILPGVPHELTSMLERDVEPWLRSRQKERSIYRRVVRIAGLPESVVEQRLSSFYAAHREEPIGILCSPGEVEIHLQASGIPEESYPKLTSMEQELRSIFGDEIYGLNHERMETVIGKLLASRGESVAVAESCTGGLLASRITDVSGSSAYFLGGVVTYSRQAKLFLLGVDPASIEANGEVSETVAREMATGVRRRFDATYGVGITGIAGPTGGTATKPVGTVHISVSSAGTTVHQRHIFAGGREQVKYQATQMALDMLRRLLIAT